MPSGSYAREPRGSYKQRWGPAVTLLDVRLDAETALKVDKAARKRGLLSRELVERIVEYVMADNLVNAVLDDGA